MRKKTPIFTINGKPMLTPDQDLSVSYSDLDDSDSGRDESGVMHRAVLRYKIAKWDFVYSSLTEEEMQYMESLFPAAPTFTFGHPGRTDSSQQEQSECYRSEYGIAWRSARDGQWKNYKFSIVEC